MGVRYEPICDPVSSGGRHGCVTMINPDTMTQYGETRDDILGLKCPQLTSFNMDGCVKWILNVYKCAGAGLSVSWPMSGSLWVSCHRSVMRDSDYNVGWASAASLRSIRDEKICSLDTISLLLLKINVMWRRGIILYKLRELSHNSPISSVEHFLDGSVKKIISLSLKLVPWATFNMFKLGGFHFHIQYSTMGLNNSIYFH